MPSLPEDLLKWYDASHRQMPWRDEPGPYRTWISEAMLQQTQVDTARPYFERFLARFPDVETLAAAPLDDVLGLWAGLGYYSRARNLHKAAKQVVTKGAFPTTVSGWRELPGVGPYMAGAICSIALGQDVATVDGNIARVLARVHREASTGRKLWHLAEQHIPPGRAGDHNQALMDLGALVCTPRSPKCPQCPIRTHCEALQVGDIEDFPAPKQRRAAAQWSMTCAVIERDGRVLLGQRPPQGMFGGLWEPPMVRASGTDAAQQVHDLVSGLGMTAQSWEADGTLRHVLTHRILEVSRFAVKAAGEPHGGSYARYTWALPEEVGSLGLSTLARKVLRR